MYVMESILRTYTNLKAMIKMGPSLHKRSTKENGTQKHKPSLIMSKSFHAVVYCLFK